MALYAIGDLHLSLGTNKSMDVFGGAWEGYVEKLKAGFSIVGPGDTTVLMGDLSWGQGLEAAAKDFAWIAQIPGKKYLLKGNHDYWWSTAAKFEKFCAAHGFQNLELLHNNCKLYGETALCGSRGWFFEEDRAGTHDDKIYNRNCAVWRSRFRRRGSGRKSAFCTIRRATGATAARKFWSCCPATASNAASTPTCTATATVWPSRERRRG